MKPYFRLHALDLCLCALLSFSLGANVFAGYDSPDVKTTSLPVIALVAMGMTLLLFLIGYNHKTAVAGGIAGGALLIVTFLLLRSSGVFGDTETMDTHPALFWIVMVLVPCICYLLSRSRIGAGVLLLSGALMAAAFGFLEYPLWPVCYLLFLLSAVLMLLYRVYRRSLLRADAGRTKPMRYAAQSLLLVLLTMGVAGGVYFGVIRPLDPPTRELKLVTRLQSLEILEKLGVSRKTEIPSEHRTTQTRNDVNQSSRDDSLENQAQQPQPEQEAPPDQQEQVLVPPQSAPARAISYLANSPGLLILLLCLALLLLALPFVLRVLRRRRWEAKLAGKSPRDQCMTLFAYLTKRLRYAGFRRPQGVTLQEYVSRNAEALSDFSVDGCDLMALTDAYQKAYYGCQPLDETQVAAFWTVYRGFRRNLRRKMGGFSYCLRLFWI